MGFLQVINSMQLGAVYETRSGTLHLYAKGQSLDFTTGIAFHRDEKFVGGLRFTLMGWVGPLRSPRRFSPYSHGQAFTVGGGMRDVVVQTASGNHVVPVHYLGLGAALFEGKGLAAAPAMTATHASGVALFEGRARGASLAMIASDAPATTSTQTLNQLLYSKLAEAFPEIVTTQNNTQYQFPMPNTLARWGGSDSDPAWDAFQISDQTPLNHGDTYVPDPSTSVSQTYGQWIQKIITDPVTNNQAYEDLIAKQQNLADQQLALATRAFGAYTTWSKTPLGVSFSGTSGTINTFLLWQNSVYGESYGVQIAALAAKIGEVTVEVDQFLKTSDLALTQIRAANVPADSTNPNFTSYTSTGGTALVAGTTAVVGADSSDLTTDLGDWRDGKNLKPFTGVLTTLDVPVHQLVTITVPVYEETSYFFGLFSSESVSYEQFTTDVTTYEHFSLSVALDSVAYYTVERAPWFDPAILQTYKANKVTGTETTQATYFDATTGSLALIPQGFLVGWNPTISITLATVTYQKYQADLESGKGIKVGPFLVGVGSKPTVSSGPAADATTLAFATPAADLGTLLPIVLGYVHYATVVGGGN
jgi:hypothetical protein